MKKLNMSNGVKLSDFDYHLPQNLIAQKPIKPRDHCRLLAVDRHCEERHQGATKPKLRVERSKPRVASSLRGGEAEPTKQSYFKHKKFFQIEKFLQKGDVLVLNDSKVIPARIYGKKTTGGSAEILLIKKISGDTWEAMLKNFKVKELGKKILISHPERQRRISRDSSGFRHQNDNSVFFVTPIKNIGEGIWQIKFNLKGAKLNKAIRKYGWTPLPPYIKSSAKLADYQTIYAQKEGSVASPTAGLHFTRQLINKLRRKGVIFEKITLHIGLGTFAPIREENIEKHKMHAEIAEISAKTAKAINKAKSEGRRIIAVGTTSARTLEAFAYSTHNLQLTTKNKNQKFKIKSGAKDVDIFIKPGYKFKIIDGMITNFHLPKTTLIILVSAFAGKDPSIYSGRDKIMRAYQEAIEKKYRFFSFGDAMLII